PASVRIGCIGTSVKLKYFYVPCLVSSIAGTRPAASAVVEYHPAQRIGLSQIKGKSHRKTIRRCGVESRPAVSFAVKYITDAVPAAVPYRRIARQIEAG